MEASEAAVASDIAFSERVKAVQARKGSREAYARLERERPWQTEITDDLAAMVALQRSFFLATASAAGQPYIQHRGGPPGFLKVLDPKTLAFADFKGNRQYISQGNLEENARAFIFLIDYRTATRVKLWGRAAVIEDQPQLLAQLMPDAQAYRAKAEQVIVFHLHAWDQNCRQHIPERYERDEVERLLAQQAAQYSRRIEKLERELAALRPASGHQGAP